MSVQHTSGPWELRPAMARDALVLGAGETGFAIFEPFDGEPGAATVRANASLSSAAPDMFNVLTLLLATDLADRDGLLDVHADAEAALAKARAA